MTSSMLYEQNVVQGGFKFAVQPASPVYPPAAAAIPGETFHWRWCRQLAQWPYCLFSCDYGWASDHRLPMRPAFALRHSPGPNGYCAGPKTTANDASSQLSAGAIAGIVIGAVALKGAVVLLVLRYLGIRRRRPSKPAWQLAKEARPCRSDPICLGTVVIDQSMLSWLYDSISLLQGRAYIPRLGPFNRDPDLESGGKSVELGYVFEYPKAQASPFDSAASPYIAVVKQPPSSQVRQWQPSRIQCNDISSSGVSLSEGSCKQTVICWILQEPKGPCIQSIVCWVVQEAVDLPMESGASSDADAVAVSIEEKAAPASGGGGSEPESYAAVSMIGTDLSGAPSQRSKCQEEGEGPPVADQPEEAPVTSGTDLEGAEQLASTISEPGSSTAGEAGQACPSQPWPTLYPLETQLRKRSYFLAMNRCFRGW